MYRLKRKHLYCSRGRLAVFLFLVFFLFFYLFSCISTPKVDDNPDSHESENSKTEKPISETETETVLTNQENVLKKSDKTQTRNTSLQKDEPGSGNTSRTNVTTALTQEKLRTNEENIFYIFFYVALFSFMYIAIVLRIIHRRQKK